MLQLLAHIEGEEHRFPLVGNEMRLGRGTDNDIILSDFSVSRHHAVLKREADGWTVYDLMSTNGVLVNGAAVRKAPIHPGDSVDVGVFEISVESDDSRSTSVAPPPAPERDSGELQSISNATIVRPISEVFADLEPGPETGGAKRKALDQAYGNKIFGFLTRLGGLLISTDAVDQVLVKVMDIAFEALPVERGFMLLTDDAGETRCRLARFGDRIEYSPKEEVPVSNTIMQTVMVERVALLSYDAQSDARLTGGESIRLHQIRAAMCTPLWSGEKIIGMLQVDSPFHAGTFNEQDLDFLTALANFAAVAVERIRNAHRAERERQVRNQLERYHSPAVIEEVMRRGDGSAEGERGLKAAEATVLFADVVGFTALAEESAPEEVAALLESYFTHAVEAIFAAGGTLDKFIGDCVMAFFGAPVPQEDHALRAVRAAVRIREALDVWNAQRERDGEPLLQARIALNSGPVVVGDIGSNRRVDYTVLGNTVNVASRLEQFVAKPGDLIIGQDTQRQVAHEFPTESLGEFQLKGLQQKITAYRVSRG